MIFKPKPPSATILTRPPKPASVQIYTLLGECLQPDIFYRQRRGVCRGESFRKTRWKINERMFEVADCCGNQKKPRHNSDRQRHGKPLQARRTRQIFIILCEVSLLSETTPFETNKRGPCSDFTSHRRAHEISASQRQTVRGTGSRPPECGSMRTHWLSSPPSPGVMTT